MSVSGRRSRRVLGATLSAGALLAFATFAAGVEHRGGPEVRTVRDVAGTSPYVGQSCNVPTPYYTQPGGKEGEPAIAVDPRNPKRRITAWMDATRATVDVTYTDDGGRSWHRSVPRGIDECTGNSSQPWEASGDPWLSVGPDGVAYLSTLTWAHFVTPPASDYVSVVHVQTSSDGGRTWSRPVSLDGQHSVSDKPMVLADPRRAGTAYEIWRNQSFGLPVGSRGDTKLLFARTDDGGETWTSPKLIAGGTPSDFFGSPQLSVLRNGTLVATTSLADAAGGTDLLSYRSTDGGGSWSAPVVVRALSAGSLPAVCGQSVAGADTGSSSGQQTVLGGRAVALVSLDGSAAAAGRGAVVLSVSRDGGRTWQSRTLLHRNVPIILASISAGREGGLGLVWDEIDPSGVDCATATVPSRTRFAVVREGRLSEAVTVGPRWWNLASGARGTGGFSGYFIGDYQSLAATPTGFTSATVQGQRLSGHGPHVTGDTGVMVADLRH